MIIRPEKPEDYETIRGLVKDAFETARVSNGDEHNFVDRLRSRDAYVPDLA